MKKLLALILSVVMLLSVMSFGVLASTTSEGYFTYEIINDEAKIINVDQSISGDVSIPSMLGGHNVTVIGKGAFYWCTQITSVTIPNSVLEIEDEAFAGCYDLRSIAIGDNVITIGNDAFMGCAITSITIPKNVTNIGDYAFAYCRDLVDVKVHPENQFYSNDEYGVLFDKEKNKLIYHPEGNDRTSYVIPDTVTTIGESAFNGSYNLSSVTIPNSVIAIDDYAFFDCNNLFNITLPNSVSTIGEGAFLACFKLESIELHKSVTIIGDGAFSNCYSLKDVYYFGSESQWRNISIEINNECLTNANIHYLGVENHEHSYTYVITKPANHLTEGIKTFTCSCGNSYIEAISKTTEHTYFVLNIVEPTCKFEGYTTYMCECGHTYNGDRTPARGHNYSGDSCIDCGESNYDNCSCNCHKNGLMGIIWKILNFFYKIFGMNKTCSCGVAHY